MSIFYNKEIETLPIHRLRDLQDHRLRELVQYAYHSIPAYKEKFKAAGVDPDRIEGIEDLHKLPFTYKSDLRDNYPFGMFATPMNEVIRIHASSGTTGKPTVVGYTQKDLDIFSEVVARSLVAAGARPGMKLHNAYGYGLFTGGLGMHYGGELLGMSVVPVSGGMTDRQIMLLQDFGSEVICCTPSYALALAEEIERRGISKDDLKVKYAILGAEPWTETIRDAVERKLGVVATNIYGLSEIIGPGVSQEDWEEKNGSHIWEDHFYPEVIDPDTEAVLPEGKEGVLVFTTLTKKAMPLIRYRTNDITYLFYDKSAKRTHIKMGPIKGRADDMLIIRGVNLFPTQVEAVLHTIPEFSAHYQLVVSRKQSLDEIEVRVELDEDIYREKEIEDIQAPLYREFSEGLSGKLTHKIKDTIGLNMRIILENFGKVPRSTGGKLSRVIDNRKL